MKNLYASMDEPDGVTGAAAVRKEEPSLHEQILQHESTGCDEKTTFIVNSQYYTCRKCAGCCCVFPEGN